MPPTEPEGQARENHGSAAPSPASDNEKTNWRPVYVALAIAVALTLATVLWLNRPQEEVSSPEPSGITRSSAEPKPTPTPDPREAEIAAAQEVYEKYSDAIVKMGKEGGSKKATKEVHRYTTGRNWDAVKTQSARLRKVEITISGNAKPHFNSAQNIKLDATPPTLLLQVCLDQRDLLVKDQSGQKRNPTWIRSDVTMVQNGGAWLVAQRSDKEEQLSCIE